MEQDLLEAVFLLPDNLFYNTPASAVVMVLNRQKQRPREFLMVHASQLFTKGRPKNFLEDTHVADIAEDFSEWRNVPARAAIATTAQVAATDFNLSPNRYVTAVSHDHVLSLEDAVELLKEAEVGRQAADAQLWKTLRELGVS